MTGAFTYLSQNIIRCGYAVIAGNLLKDVIERKFLGNCFFYSQKIRTFAPAKQKETQTGALVQ